MHGNWFRVGPVRSKWYTMLYPRLGNTSYWGILCNCVYKNHFLETNTGPRMLCHMQTQGPQLNLKHQKGKYIYEKRERIRCHDICVMIFGDLMMKPMTLYPNLKFSLKSSSFKRQFRVKTTNTFSGLTSPNSLNRTCLQFYILFDLTNDILVLKNNVGEGENLCHSAHS